MEIIAYLKPICGWSNGVRAIMKKYDLKYTDKNIIHDRDNYLEMVKLSGQPLSPCVVIDGVMLADVSGEEVENYLLSNNLVNKTEKGADAPINRSCTDAEHESMRQKEVESKSLRFF